MICQACPNPTAGPYAKYCLACGAQKRKKPARWIPTPEIDELIQKAWREGHGKGAAQFVAHRTGWPDWAVKGRALAIGAFRREKKEPNWSPEEIAVLEKFIWMGEKRLQLKLRSICGTRRTCTGIHLKKKRLKLRVGDSSGYSVNQLAQLIGSDPRGISRRWIGLGWLKAQRRGSERTEQQGGDTWYVEHKAVYQFVIQHPEEIDLGRVDKMWFLNLMTSGKVAFWERAA